MTDSKRMKRIIQPPESPYDDGNISMVCGSSPLDETRESESYGVVSGQFCQDFRDTRTDDPVSPPDEESPPIMPILDKRAAVEYDMSMATIQDTIRAAIQKSGKTRYAIWKESGISQSHLSLFMREKRGMTVTMLERIAPILNLEIIVRPKRKKRK